MPDMFFVMDYDHFGEVRSHELVPNGSNIKVTNENKQEFVRRLSEWRLSRSTERQMRALAAG